MLESAIAANAAVKIFEDVDRGALAFDRTLKVGELDKDNVSDRLPENVATIRRLIERNRALVQEYLRGDAAGGKAGLRALRRLVRSMFMHQGRRIAMFAKLPAVILGGADRPLRISLWR